MWEEKLKKLEASGYKTQGGFRNEYGERYFIFTHHLIHGFLIAGDETDWEVLELAENGAYAFERFIFNEDEQKEIAEILKTLKK